MPHLSSPVVDKESGCSTLPGGIVFGHSTMQGWRATLEDAYTCAVDFDKRNPGRHLFAVFDGHGGPEVARYVSEQLPKYLLETDSYQRGNFDQALKDAFLGLDAKLLEPAVLRLRRLRCGTTSTAKATAATAGPGSGDNEEEDNSDKDYVPGDEVPDDEEEEEEEDKDADDEEEEEEEAEGEEGENDEECEEAVDEEEADSDEVSEEESEEDYNWITPVTVGPGVDSGTTAVVALLVDGRLYVANAGDSRAVLSDAGVAVDMSKDHKPEDKPELQRIEAAGGHLYFKHNRSLVHVHWVTNMRGLSMSRALGDHDFKQNAELSADKQIISSMPDVRCVDLADSHRFLLLACDGIWDSMSSQEAVDFCGQRLTAGCPPDQVCEALLDHCLAPELGRFGCDNMTAVLVCLSRQLQLPADVAGADAADANAADGANGGSSSLGESESKKIRKG